MGKTLLELFSGTGSVGRVAEVFGYDVVSLDLKDAKIVVDILEWDYTKINPDEIDVIWASPPCTEYSKAKTTGVRKIDYANKIVLKTIEIIEYFKPAYWFIENPQTGLLKEQSFMKDFGFYDVDYCKYGFRYRKRTRLWCNLKGWTPRPLCKKDCGSVVDGKHIETAQRMPSGKKSEWGDNYIIHKQDDLYKIPTTLISDILGCCTF